MCCRFAYTQNYRTMFLWCQFFELSAFSILTFDRQFWFTHAKWLRSSAKNRPNVIIWRLWFYCYYSITALTLEQRNNYFIIYFPLIVLSIHIDFKVHFITMQIQLLILILKIWFDEIETIIFRIFQFWNSLKCFNFKF